MRIEPNVISFIFLEPLKKNSPNKFTFLKGKVIGNILNEGVQKRINFYAELIKTERSFYIRYIDDKDILITIAIGSHFHCEQIEFDGFHGLNTEKVGSIGKFSIDVSSCRNNIHITETEYPFCKKSYYYEVKEVFKIGPSTLTRMSFKANDIMWTNELQKDLKFWCIESLKKEQDPLRLKEVFKTLEELNDVPYEQMTV